MNTEMKLTYSDGLGLATVEIDESGITCDGEYAFFADTEDRDYRIPLHNVFSIVNE